MQAVVRQHIVAAAVVRDGRVLLARRHAEAHQGGLWEFPGGKVEPGETITAALARELDEELGITPEVATPLISIPYDYSDKSITLDVWRVDHFSGEPHGQEGQPLEWVALDELHRREFPAANLPVITALQLPPYYLITPDPEKEGGQFLAQLESSLQAGVRLVQLRAKSLSVDDYCVLATEVKALCRCFGATLLLNGSAAQVERVGADGLHLGAQALMSLNKRPVDSGLWLSASCHDIAELRHACDVGVDFLLLSPVMPTQTHPGAETLGWQEFTRLAAAASVPVFALGGMTTGELSTAQQGGAQGVAAIGALWGLTNPLADSR